MEFFDCNKYFDKADVFQSISREDLKYLHMENQERQGIFKPVVTSTHLPVRAALIGLNGYAGDDYLEFFAHANPMVRACQEHPPLVEKLPIVIGEYRSKLPELTEGAFYFTNFVKIYPPASEFSGASAMDKALNKSPSLTALFSQYLKDEVDSLVKDGCRVFICFGNVASRYFMETLSCSQSEECQVVDGIGNNLVRRCKVNGSSVFILSERHYAYYAKATTRFLASVLANAYDRQENK